jgi:hypothetical protein
MAPTAAAVPYTYTDPAPNPAWPEACGVDVALVIDHSNSIKRDNTGNPATLKQAASGFVDALTGTPSRVGVVSFWETAKVEVDLTSTAETAGADAVKDRIAAIPFELSDPRGSTNWDEAFRALDGLSAAPRIAFVLTDGRPTVNHGDHDSGGTTDFADVNEAIKSANGRKAAGTRIVALGIGGSIDADNLKRISGPKEDDDYFLTDFDEVGARLRELVTKMCGGTVTVTKKVRTETGPKPEGGWAFNATGDPKATPDDGMTDDNGHVVFAWKASAPLTVEITEVQQNFTELEPQDGQNAQCLVDGKALAVENVDQGVRLTLGPTDIVSCQFLNRRLGEPAVQITKTATPETIRPGGTVRYDYLVTNIGEVPLDKIEVTDDRCGPVTPVAAQAELAGLLPPDGARQFTCSTPVDEDTVNTATVKATDSFGRNATDTDTAAVDVVRAALDLVKTGPGMAHEGDGITYTLKVTNSGDVALTGIEIEDAVAGADIEPFDLAPGATREVKVPFTVPAGTDEVVNMAEACAPDPTDGGAPVCDDATHTIDVIHPAIAVDKVADPAAVSGPSGDVTFSYKVTNTGDVDLGNVAVDDDILGIIGTIGDLAPGASGTLTRVATITPSGPLTNTATATGTDPLDRKVTATDTAIISVVLGETIEAPPTTPPQPDAIPVLPDAIPELPRTGAPLQGLATAGALLGVTGLVARRIGRRN